MTVTPITIAKRRPNAVVKAEWNAELDEHWAYSDTPLKCLGKPAIFTEFGRNRPTVAEAEALCAGCPMMAGGNLCREYGVATKGDGLIYGGAVFVDGKPVLKDTYAVGGDLDLLEAA